MHKPHLFSFTWHPYAIDPKVDYSKEIPTAVEFRLEPVKDGTHLSIIESGFETLPDHRKADALRANSGGWEKQIENIKAYVEKDARIAD